MADKGAPGYFPGYSAEVFTETSYYINYYILSETITTKCLIINWNRYSRVTTWDATSLFTGEIKEEFNMDFLNKAVTMGKELDEKHDLKTKGAEAVEKVKKLDEEHKIVDKAKELYEKNIAK